MAEDIRPRAGKAPNGSGSIYPYRSGWRGALTWTEGGRQRRKTISGKSQADVRRRLTRIRAELDEGRAPAPSGTVAAFLTDWLEGARQWIRPATWRAYRQAIELYLVPELGRLELARLKPSDVERMTAAVIAGGRSPRTAHTARAVLRRALADALRDGLIHRNEAALARAPHVPSRSLEPGRHFLAAADLRRLVNESKLHPIGALVAVAAGTGLRLGEILGLQWRDIDLEAGTVRVARSMAMTWDGGWAVAEPKSAKSRRTVHLPAAAIAALRRQDGLQAAARDAAGAAWQDTASHVFTDALGRPLRADYVNHRWHELLEAVGLPSLPFHALRHSYASAALAGGVGLKVVSEALGHSTIAITADTYAGVMPAQRREAADALDRALAES
jgi:integrase